MALSSFARAEAIRADSRDYFWIGCADSRVPANVITRRDPGQMAG